MAAPTLNTPIVTETLNCTQPALRRMTIAWVQNSDGTMGLMRASADVSPYDPAQNKCDPRIQTVNIYDVATLAAGLTAAGRLQLATALQAILDAMGDLTNNGIPDNLKKSGFIANSWGE